MGPDKRVVLSFSVAAMVVLCGCDRMVTSPTAQTLKDADTKASEGDYMKAINLYEAALDETARCADIHYKLALLYDDKLNDPLDALHHFKRYLVLNPNGTRAGDVKNYVKRDEIALVTSLSGDSVVTPAEAARLRNENLSLRQQLDGRATPRPNAPATRKARHNARHGEG